MNFYTVVLRQSREYWVALCLENGIVGQGDTQEQAITKQREAVQSFQEVYASQADVSCNLISIKELHEFLTLESKEPVSEAYEFRAVYA
ncbi:MAG: type II toxin-antitoxin system HicB family antitoxin [Symploca sp. SIO2G7]|nr:type II toxin-antitoxin system HicB family antitoxin [Symploca sp. SIO2G7]